METWANRLYETDETIEIEGIQRYKAGWNNLKYAT